MLEPDFAIVGIVTDGRDLIDEARALKPDIIILNTSMPRLNGLDAGEQIKRKLPATKLVFLTASLKADIVAEVFRRGASACVPSVSGSVAGPYYLQNYLLLKFHKGRSRFVGAR
jgi:DNA-binding NarL/FixJ family response regulator